VPELEISLMKVGSGGEFGNIKGFDAGESAKRRPRPPSSTEELLRTVVSGSHVIWLQRKQQEVGE
jgi:hypothetical protein